MEGERIVALQITPEEMEIINRLRETNPSQQLPSHKADTPGQRLSDAITRVLGSWRFIIIQTIILTCWIAINIWGWLHQWDPYPFILLNLFLSFQAAYTAPIIMMSQNREAKLDRLKMQYSYEVNVKNELEIELLHHKFDLLLAKLDR